AQGENLVRDVRIPFPAAIPALVVVRSVAIVVSVDLVVLLVIRNEVTETESVMAGDKVYALIGAVCVRQVVREKIAAPIKPGHKLGDHAWVAPNKRAQIIAELPVPLQPRDAREGFPQLIACRVPGFGNEPNPFQLWGTA